MRGHRIIVVAGVLCLVALSASPATAQGTQGTDGRVVRGLAPPAGRPVPGRLGRDGAVDRARERLDKMKERRRVTLEEARRKGPRNGR